MTENRIYNLIHHGIVKSTGIIRDRHLFLAMTGISFAFGSVDPKDSITLEACRARNHILLNPRRIHSPMDFVPYLRVALKPRLSLSTPRIPPDMMHSTASCHVLMVSGRTTKPSPMCLGVWASLPAVIGLPILFANARERLLSLGTERPFLASIPSNG